MSEASQVESDKEGMFRAVGALLSRGYALSNVEVFELADAYGVTRGTAPGALMTKDAQVVMDEVDIVPFTTTHMGRKIWIDAKGKTNPEEIYKTRQLIDNARKKTAA